MRVRVLLFVVVVVGLALLAACAGGGEQPTSSPTPAASAENGAELAADQAIQRVLELMERAPDEDRPDPSTATARRMTECEAFDLMGWEGVARGRPPTPLSESPVWLVEVRGEFSGLIGYRLTPDSSPPVAGRFVQIVQLDGSFGGAAYVSDERAQEGPERSRESILERALDEVAPAGSENEPDPSTATITRMTYGEALDAVREEGAPQDFSERPHQDDPVWLFEIRGEFVDSCEATLRPGRYFLVLALDGFVESSGFVPEP